MVHPVLQCWDSHPRPFKHESSPITTRPGLPSQVLSIFIQSDCLHNVMLKLSLSDATPYTRNKFFSTKLATAQVVTFKQLYCLYQEQVSFSRAPNNRYSICQIFVEIDFKVFGWKMLFFTLSRENKLTQLDTQQIQMIYKLVFIPQTSLQTGDQSEIPTISKKKYLPRRVTVIYNCKSLHQPNPWSSLDSRKR